MPKKPAPAKAASRAQPTKPMAAAKPKARPLSKPAAKPKAVAKPKVVAKPKAVSKPMAAPAKSSARKAPGLWPAFAAGLAITGDAGAASTSLHAMLAPKGDATGLFEHLARGMGAQLTRGTAAARRKAAQPVFGTASLEAAQEILNVLKIYVAAADVLRAQGEEIVAAYESAARPAQKKFQSDLGKLALAVTQERTLADVPALMAASVGRVLQEAKDSSKGAKGKGAAK